MAGLWRKKLIARHRSSKEIILSAFAVIYERSNTLGIPGAFGKVMERLRHRGPDGNNILSLGAVTMGHWHFWTTPEEVGECQPLGLGDTPYKIVLDGRIDNRSEIISKLGGDLADSIHLSDAALIMMAFQRWNKDCFLHLVGEFALVIFDQEKNELVCARDHLGDRTLFFSANDERFVVASEPWAVLGAGTSKPQLNENTIAHHFAARVPENGETFFSGVYELLPAHVMIVDQSGHTTQQYWQLDPSKKVRFKTEKEYADRFLELLEESVRCRMRSVTPVAVLMSGGLDSASIACLAARMSGAQPLTAISVVFDELAECDERVYINAVQDKWRINSVQIRGDDNWTFRNWEQWPHNPNHPEGNLYRLNLEQAYQRTSDEGIRVLLSGHVGDALYLAGEEWLADLILERRFSEAWSGLMVQARLKGLRFLMYSGHLRATIRALLRRFAPWILAWRRRTPTSSAWLCPVTKQYLGKNQRPLPPELERHSTLLGPYYAYGCSRGSMNASRHRIEMRLPYHDRRLVEFVVGLPAYMLYCNGLYKHILRLAMQDILPEAIRHRRKPTSMGPLYFRGLEREDKVWRSSLYGGDHLWERFVDAAWLLKRLSNPSLYMEGRTELRLAWLCISFERWYQSFINPQEVHRGYYESY
jgi:asparagine synthase (glutamine-hydrolysing)